MIGMGNGGQIISTAGSVAGSGLTIGLISAGAVAGPIGIAIGGLVAGAAALVSALGIGSGCGNSCVQATSIVNQAEVVLKQNLAAYQAGQLSQTDAMANFNQIWSAVQQSCAAIPGAAGSNCIGDRQRGGKWDWFAMYYDPIINTPPVSNDSSSMTSLFSSGNSWLLLGALGLVVIGVASK